MHKKPRVKRLHLSLTRTTRLVISLRRFKTNKARRSKLKQQIVFPARLFSTKEIAIEKIWRKRRMSRHSSPWQWQLRTQFAALTLIVLGIGGSLYFAANLNIHIALEPVVSAQTLATAETAPPSPTTLPRSVPTQIRIARVGINAPITPVGLKFDKSMEIPAYNQAGWYNLAPTPGELGPAIIVGHVDSPNGPAVFWRLRELQPGDIVEIDRADSKIVKFKIDKVKQFPSNNLPTQEIYGDIDHAGIRLMTCSGTFDRQTRRYDQNIVAFGSLAL